MNVKAWSWIPPCNLLRNDIPSEEKWFRNIGHNHRCLEEHMNRLPDSLIHEHRAWGIILMLDNDQYVFIKPKVQITPVEFI